jgi:hypothetical protein
MSFEILNWICDESAASSSSFMASSSNFRRPSKRSRRPSHSFLAARSLLIRSSSTKISELGAIHDLSLLGLDVLRTVQQHSIKVLEGGRMDPIRVANPIKEGVKCRVVVHLVSWGQDTTSRGKGTTDHFRHARHYRNQRPNGIFGKGQNDVGEVGPMRGDGQQRACRRLPAKQGGGGGGPDMPFGLY